MDVEQPVQQRRAAGDVFGAPGVVTRVMAYCATLEDVSRLSRARAAGERDRSPWPPVAPGFVTRRTTRRAAATATETTRWAGVWPSRRARARRANRAPRGREGDDRARGRGRRRRHEARRRGGVGAGCGCRGGQARAGGVRAADGGHLRRAMAHAALAGVLVADGPMIAREAAASALTSLLRRVRSGPGRARAGASSPTFASGVRCGFGAPRDGWRYSGDGGRAVRGAVSVAGAPVAGAAGRGLTSPFLFPSSL